MGKVERLVKTGRPGSSEVEETRVGWVVRKAAQK
jgi:hypothetical protein